MDNSIVDKQTEILNTTDADLEGEKGKYQQLANQQSEMYESAKFINNVLIAFYVFIFTVIHVMYLKQYMEGVKRDEWKDSFWISVFFLYPYMIYMIQTWIYKIGLYIWSMITGTVYIPKFNQLLVSGDYYKGIKGKPNEV